MDSKVEEDLKRDGFTKVEDILSENELLQLRDAIDPLIYGDVDTSNHRSDLAASLPKGNSKFENVTQVMWPSEYTPGLRSSPLYLRAEELAKLWLGNDMAFDFDMIFFKAPNSAAPTPFHQDIAYWPNLTDRRALSCWFALDESSLDNGCMWFVPGSHLEPPRKHWVWDQKSKTLTCAGTEAEANPIPLKRGSCTFHFGETVHYSRGNTTEHERGALIINFRPHAMILEERRLGFDHGRTVNVRENRNVATRAET